MQWECSENAVKLKSVWSQSQLLAYEYTQSWTHIYGDKVPLTNANVTPWLVTLFGIFTESGILTEVRKQLYHVVLIAYHKYASTINTCRDYQYPEACVWYDTFKFHIFLTDSRCDGRLGSGLAPWGSFRIRVSVVIRKYVTQGPKTRHLSFLTFFVESYSTLHLLQNAFYRIKISRF